MRGGVSLAKGRAPCTAECVLGKRGAPGVGVHHGMALLGRKNGVMFIVLLQLQTVAKKNGMYPVWIVVCATFHHLESCHVPNQYCMQVARRMRCTMVMQAEHASIFTPSKCTGPRVCKLSMRASLLKRLSILFIVNKTFSHPLAALSCLAGQSLDVSPPLGRNIVTARLVSESRQ